MRQLSNERCSHTILLTLSRIKTNIALSYLSSCNWSRTQNHLIRKRTHNHFGQTMVDSLWNVRHVTRTYVTWQEHTVYHISLTLKLLSSQPEQEICKLLHVLAVFCLHKWKALREKCPSTEFFLVRIFMYSDWIQENTDQKKLHIWVLFIQWRN